MNLRALFLSLVLALPVAAQGGGGRPPALRTLQEALDYAPAGATISASEFPTPRRALRIQRPVTLVGGLYLEAIVLDAEAHYRAPVRLVGVRSRLATDSLPAVWNVSRFDLDLELHDCELFSDGDYGVLGGENAVAIFDSTVEVSPLFGLAVITNHAEVRRSSLRGSVAIRAGVLVHKESIFDGFKLVEDYELCLDGGGVLR